MKTINFLYPGNASFGVSDLDSHGTALQILYTHRTRGVGAEGAHIMGMVEAFRELGHEVQIDCLPGCDPFVENFAPRGGDFSGRVRNTRSLSRNRWWDSIYRIIADHSPQLVFGIVELLYNVPLLWRLGWKVRRPPDLVYERYALGNFAPALLCWILRIPRVVEINDSVVIERSRPLSIPRVKRTLERLILSSADLVITVSQQFQSQILNAFPQLAESTVWVLPNAVSEARFREIPVKTSDSLHIRMRFGDKTLLGSAGQFLQWHGLAPMIEAMADLAKERNLGFLFVGDGPARDEVMSVARAGGVEDRVIFTGMVSHILVPEYLSLLDIAVIPSAAVHASPMKLMEFMALGLPVVAPDLPSIREVLENGRTGRTFQPGNMADMCLRLVEMLEDRHFARELGLRGREHVLSHLTWDGHARKILGALGLR